MLTKETKTAEVYFFKGKGPYESEQCALESYLMSKHTYYSDRHLNLESLFSDKEFLIALGEWAKEETKSAN
jgi:hypothetical protein